MPLNPTFTSWLALNGANDTSPTYNFDINTGVPIYGGAVNLGDYFDLTEAEAKLISYTTLPQVQLHAGRYRRIQVDSGATASNVKTGTVGLMVAGLQPNLNVVTSYDKGIVGAHAVLFLNAITPGNYGYVQELGIGSVLMGSTITGTAVTGALVNSTTLGVGDVPTTQEDVPASLGIALSPPAPSTLCQVLLKLPVLQG